MRIVRVIGLTAIVSAVAGLAVATAAASGGKLGGRITADGSSTVGPYVTAAAEGFQKLNKGVQVTVGISGTGGGFERFCHGETDISNASRPVKAAEAASCRENGIRYIAFAVANDGLSVVVNKDNTWARCLTVVELKKIWEPGSNMKSWKDIRPSFKDEGVKLFGPGTDSGTFDFFTEHIVGKSRASRSDYQASEDDNVLVLGVSGEQGGLGYFGLSYYEENRDKLKVLAIDGGKGCVAPSVKTVQNRSYPISRPLFVYAKLDSFKKPEVQAFIDYILDNEASIAKRARYVPLTQAQLGNARRQHENAVRFAKKSA